MSNFDRFRGWYPVAIAFALVGFSHLTYALVFGATWSPDSYTYDTWSDKLLAHRFHYFSFVRDSGLGPGIWSYTGWLTVLAGLKVVFGSEWVRAVVAANLLASACSAALIAACVKRVTSSYSASLYSTGLFLVAFDQGQWTRYVLSDSTFAFLVVAWFWVWTRGFLAERDQGISLVGITSLAGLMFFYRPPGVILLPLSLLGTILLVMRSRILASIARRPRGLSQSFLLLAGIVLVIILMHDWIMQDPNRWPFARGGNVIRITSDHYRMGEVVWDRHNTFHALPVSYGDYVWITLDRLAHFFYFFSAAFSLRHNLAGAVFFICVYPLALFAAWSHIRPSSPHSPARRLVTSFAVVVIVFFAVMHALMIIDFDWRYRLPIVGFLVFLGPTGLDEIWSRHRRQLTHAQ